MIIVKETKYKYWGTNSSYRLDGGLWNFKVFLKDGGIMEFWDYKDYEHHRKLEYKRGKLIFTFKGKRYVLGEDIPYENIRFYDRCEPINGRDIKPLEPDTVEELEEIIGQRAREGFN